MRFTYDLARELGMTRRRLLAEADADEIAHWQALRLLERREAQQAEKELKLKADAQRGVTDVKRRLKHGRSGHRRN